MLEVAGELVRGGQRVVVLNMASAKQPGGGVAPPPPASVALVGCTLSRSRWCGVPCGAELGAAAWRGSRRWGTGGEPAPAQRRRALDPHAGGPRVPLASFLAASPFREVF